MSLLQGFTQAIRIDLQGSSTLGSTFAGATAELDRFANSARRLGVLGGILTGVGVAMTGFAAVTAASTIRSQEALGEMASLGYQDLDLLEQAASDFSSRFAGATKSEFIRAAYDIKSGIASLSDEGVADFTRLAAMTARATRSTVSEMTSLFATAYGIYKGFYGELSDSEFGELFSGGLAAAVQQFKTTGPGMARAISNLGASATTALVPMEEQLAVLGMLQATMSGEEAGTKYRQFMLTAARAGQQLGLSFTDAHGQLLPMADILDVLRVRFGGTIDAAEKLQIREAFGTVEALAVVDLMIGKTGELRSNIESLGIAMSGGSILTLEMAEAMDRGLGPVLTLTRQRLANTFEALGRPMAEMIGPVLDRISGTVNAFRSWAETHPGLVKLAMGTVLISGAVLTLVGGLLLAGAGFGTLASGLIGAASAIGIGTAGTLTLSGAVVGLGTAIWTALAPILPIVAAVATVAGVLYLAWKGNLFGLRDAVTVAWTNIRAAFDAVKIVVLAVWTSVRSVFDGWMGKLREWYESWNDTFIGAASPLVRFVEIASYSVGYVWGLFLRFVEWVQPALQAAFEVVTTALTTVWHAIAGLFRIGLALIQGDWAGAWQAMKETAVQLFTDLRSLLAAYARYFVEIWNLLAGTVGRLFSGIWTSLKEGFFGLLNFFIERINGLVEIVNLVPGLEIPALETFGQMADGTGSSEPASVVSSAIHSVDRAKRSVQVDRSIHGITLNVNPPAGSDTRSIRQAFIEALEEVAGQSDGIEEVTAYAG